MLAALVKAEKAPKLGIDGMFDDVYDTLPRNLREQAAEVEAHASKYPEYYL